MAYKFNPFTGAFDYYESGGGGGGPVVDPSIIYQGSWLWTASDSIFNNTPLNFKPQISGTGSVISGDEAAISTSLAQLNVTSGTAANTLAILHAAFNNASSGQFLLNTLEYIYEGSCFVDRLGAAGTDRGEQYIGWASTRAAALPSDCAMFGYEPDVSGNWILRNGQGSVYDIDDSGIAVVAGAIINYKLRIATVSGNYTSELYIGDTLVASSSARMPTDHVGIVHRARSVDAGAARKLSMVGKQTLTIKAGI